MQLLDHRLGRVCLFPSDPVVAGTVGQWTLTYTVGSYGIDEGGTIKIARRFASDWERPQFEDPGGPGYTTATTTGEARLALRYDPKAHVRPWMKCLVIDVYDGCLAPGDTVTITLGDRSGGGPGIRAQSFLESAHEIRVLVDPTNACLVRRLPSSPVVPIVAGPPVSLVVITPMEAKVGEPIEVFVKGEDRWGNPTSVPDGVSLEWEGEGAAAWEGTTLRLRAPGSGKVVATWQGARAEGNPTTAYAERPKLRRWWGDLHAQSDATVGTGTEVEYFAFGRDWARLDVMSHQGNDFQMTDEDWRRLNEVVADFHEDGRFVVFPGFEWSANTPAGGDRNVIYLEEGRPIMRSSHWQIPGTPEDERSPAHPADELFRKLRKHVPIENVLVAAHCGGRYADIHRYFDEELGPLVEVVSCWGVFEWLLWDAFEHGYRVGVMCNSDGHKGRPGAEGPGAGQFGIYGGLTCVLAESLTRQAVFTALKQRRCYGTTGPRIDLDVTVDGHPMGSSITAKGSVRVRAAVRGTAPIEALVLHRGREVIHVEQPAAFGELGGSRRVRVSWGGARIRGRGRRAVWDGTVQVEGAVIERAQGFAFDSPADGILEQSEQRLRVRSRTTGDIDGVDLWLDRSGHGAARGRLCFESEVGRVEVDLATLDDRGVLESLGGLDLHVRVQRYPEAPSARTLILDREVEASGGVPLLVKAIQTDGHMAWASPVYVD
ncbi:DUF3604 domain-containing protein [Paraliomyxa miuraensis]|uniref:DUF3604 domain-containing protein n=1 Tax=Paraliomyxa miuraensis TaxID=376150 RepID=UPI002252904B|nr:DUF3604 domain-containing protein [Paraliomyxa miuraensis]